MNGGTYARLVAASSKFTRAIETRAAAAAVVARLSKKQTASKAQLGALEDARDDEKRRLEELLSAAEGVRAAMIRRSAPTPPTPVAAPTGGA